MNYWGENIINTELHDLVRHQKILEIINNDKCQTIIEALLDSTCMSGLSFKDIAQQNNMSPAVLSKYLNILVDAHIVMSTKSEPDSLYYIDEVAMFKKLFKYINELLIPIRVNWANERWNRLLQVPEY